MWQASAAEVYTFIVSQGDSLHCVIDSRGVEMLSPWDQAKWTFNIYNAIRFG